MEDLGLRAHDDLMNHEFTLAADDCQVGVEPIFVCSVGTVR